MPTPPVSENFKKSFKSELFFIYSKIPKGSLASLIIDSTVDLAGKTNCDNLSRNDLVFIEHYVIRFKRELIVGIGRKVFTAIQCHYEKRSVKVRQELLGKY